jgi:hypothetical protein
VKRDEALPETKIALGGKLAAESNTLRLQRSELLPHSLFKAIESMRRFPSLEADQAIRSGLALLPRQSKALQHERPMAALAVQPGGNLFATVGPNGMPSSGISMEIASIHFWRKSSDMRHLSSVPTAN